MSASAKLYGQSCVMCANSAAAANPDGIRALKLGIVLGESAQNSGSSPQHWGDDPEFGGSGPERFARAVTALRRLLDRLEAEVE